MPIRRGNGRRRARAPVPLRRAWPAGPTWTVSTTPSDIQRSVSSVKAQCHAGRIGRRHLLPARAPPLFVEPVQKLLELRFLLRRQDRADFAPRLLPRFLNRGLVLLVNRPVASLRACQDLVQTLLLRAGQVQFVGELLHAM